jgi:hypothetical protein
MLLEQSPDPNHCWVRFTPRNWPGARDLWLDLFTLGLGRGGAAAARSAGGPLPRTCDDVVYLPPVEANRAGRRSDLIEQAVAQAIPLLVQALPGESPASPQVTWVYDLLQVLVSRQTEALADLPQGSAAVWPLIGGYTDDPGLWQEGLGLLAEAGVQQVQGINAVLSPAERRRLVEEAGDEGFDRLFHGRPPSERAFASAVHRHGMAPFLERPLPESPGRLRGNRALAADLALAGELWLRLGRAESRGQSLYRAARWVDRESHDLVALAEDGNLGVVTWLDRVSREVVEELVAQGESSLLVELTSEYLEAAPTGS